MNALLAFFRRLRAHLRHRWWLHVLPLLIRRRGLVMGARVRFFGTPILSMAARSSISIGDDCVICSNSEMTALGVDHPVVMRTLEPGASITIGPNSGISGGAFTAVRSITIGRDCLFGANVTVSDTDFHPVDSENRRNVSDPSRIRSAAVTIGDNVFVGTGSIILKGVSIGRNSVIGAGSVVIRDVPENSVFAGNPARFLRNL